MREFLLKAHFGCQCHEVKSLLGIDWTCVGVHQKRANIKNSIVMAVAMTSCLFAILAANIILQIVLRIVEIFTNICMGKFYKQMVALIQSRSLELHNQHFLNLLMQESCL